MDNFKGYTVRTKDKLSKLHSEIRLILKELVFILKNNSWVIKICLYSDERVAPFGVTSIEERLIENRKRLENRGILMSEEKYIFIKNSLLELEQQIFTKCKIKPSDITDEAISSLVLGLKNFVVK